MEGSASRPPPDPRVPDGASRRDDTVAVRVWDLPVRLFHWALVVLLAFSWWSAEQGHMDWHMRSGYALLTLVLFRIVWGFVGSTHARFSDFIRGPEALVVHLRALPSRRAPAHAGHNPLGGIGVVLMLAAVLVQAATGLFASDDILVEGPLYRHVSGATSEWLTSVHRTNFDALLVLAAIHVAAVAFHRLFKRQDLIGPMFTGRKRLPRTAVQPGPGPGPGGVAAAQPRTPHPALAIVVLALCAGAVWLVVSL
jgi:cytochrome b